MKHYKLLTLALCAVFFISGCSSVGNIVTKERTPTDTLKALNDASKKKDTAAIKKLLSKGTNVLLENAALAANTSSDELLKKDDGAPFEDLPEIRGEKIEGETATVTVANQITSEDENIPLVKEDGEWKVALDKYLEDLKKRYDEDMNKMRDEQSLPSNSNSKSAEVPKENKPATNKK
jgi:uncharacterized lipoprotein